MTLRRLAQWVRQSCTAKPASAPAAAVESLEGRRLMAAGPQVTNIALLGTAKACTGVVLTFNEHLDPARAGDIRAFSIGRVKHPSSSNGLNLTDFLPFLARPLSKVIKARKVQFAQDIYDDTAMTITLIPNGPFAAWKYFRAVRIRGKGDFALTDTAGNPFDGNGDGTGGDDIVLTWVYHKGKKITIKEQDGDKIILQLKGPGKLYDIQHNFDARDPMIFVDSANPAKSILTGRVIQGKHGDGIADIRQISGLSSVQTTLPSNLSFKFGAQFA
jgi:hypothetical protein